MATGKGWASPNRLPSRRPCQTPGRWLLCPLRPVPANRFFCSKAACPCPQGSPMEPKDADMSLVAWACLTSPMPGTGLGAQCWVSTQELIETSHSALRDATSMGPQDLALGCGFLISPLISTSCDGLADPRARGSLVAAAVICH